MQQTVPRAPSSARAEISRSVFLNQMLLGGSVLVLVIIVALVEPRRLAQFPFFAGVVLVFAATALAAAVPWGALPKAAIAILPVIDIVAVGLVSAEEDTFTAGMLLVFPVIWLATHFGLPGTVGGTVMAAVAVWSASIFHDQGLRVVEFPGLAIVPIMMFFIAGVTYSTVQRSRAQRALLRQQAGLLNAELRRSRRQERTLDEILNAVDFSVVGFDAQGKPNLINRAHRELMAKLGVPSDDVVEGDVYREDGVTPFAPHEMIYLNAIRGERVDRVTVWVGKPGATRVALLVSTRPILDEHGMIDGGIMVSYDITAELRAVQARDDLVASVSHELRTPLTSITGYLDLALDHEQLDPPTRRMLEIAVRNAERMLVIVTDLLSAASETEHGVLYSFDECQLSALVMEAVDSIRPLAADREIRIDVQPLPSVRLQGDALRLRQVVDNLLSNAVKYNRRAGTITVALDATQVAAELSVTDTGRGMTPEEQTNLFDRFYRADSVRRSMVPGTGLGLRISRDIVRRHGGDLRLVSESGRGTTATVSLPLGRKQRL